MYAVRGAAVRLESIAETRHSGEVIHDESRDSGKLHIDVN